MNELRDSYENICWKATLALQAKNPCKSLSKRETLKAFNLCLICLFLFKFSTFANFSMLFQVMIFSSAFGEFLKSHVTGDTNLF